MLQRQGRFFSCENRKNKQKLIAVCSKNKENRRKKCTLTFKNRTSYIQDEHTDPLQMLHFMYFFQQI
jgi:hypothetical protein